MLKCANTEITSFIKSSITGKWSDGSEEWDKIEQHYLYRRHEADGIFWMQYSDFLAQFTHVNISPFDMRNRRGTHKRQHSICSDQFDLIINHIRQNSHQYP